jgi:hypothetical protein
MELAPPELTKYSLSNHHGLAKDSLADKFLVLLCYKMSTFISNFLALALIISYVEVDEPPPDVFIAPA